MGRDPLVLILSNAQDTHVPLVSRALDVGGCPWLRLDTETFGAQTIGEFALGLDRSGVWLRTGKDEIAIDQVSAVWYRRPEPPVLPAMPHDEARQFAEAELKSFLDGLISLVGCRWLSEPGAIRRAGHKLLQLRLALQLGFDVPPTLVSQLPQAIRDFRHAVGGPLVAKLVSKGPPRAATPERQYVVFTEVLDDAALEDDAILAFCPAIYQPYIEKAFELRVTVVGEQVFACRIDSQATERTRIDWRNYDLANTPHAPFDLDPRHRALCLRLVRELGLAFGAIDLIVTPEGRTIFLEINPNGQWGWIEELTGLPIAAAHAAFLAGT